MRILNNLVQAPKSPVRNAESPVTRVSVEPGDTVDIRVENGPQSRMDFIGRGMAQMAESMATMTGIAYGAAAGGYAGMQVAAPIINALPKEATTAALVTFGLLGTAGLALGGYVGAKIAPRAMQMATQEGASLAEKAKLSRGLGKAVVATMLTAAPLAAAPLIGDGWLSAIGVGAVALGGVVGAAQHHAANK
ncbi:MAG: hypothetical protein AB7S38_39830 [Vulcanimicrobiota bacterium]